MSRSFSKSPIWATAVIVGLVAATALVADYVERPGNNTQVTNTTGKCDACPLKGTLQCCKAETKASCSESACTASLNAEDKDGSGCCGKEPAACGSEASETKTGCGGGRCSLEPEMPI